MLEIPSKHAPKIDDLAWDKDNDSLAILTVSLSSNSILAVFKFESLDIGDERNLDLLHGSAQVLRYRDGQPEGEGHLYLMVRCSSSPCYRFRQRFSRLFQQEKPAQDPMHLQARQESNNWRLEQRRQSHLWL